MGDLIAFYQGSLKYVIHYFDNHQISIVVTHITKHYKWFGYFRWIYDDDDNVSTDVSTRNIFDAFSDYKHNKLDSSTQIIFPNGDNITKLTITIILAGKYWHCKNFRINLKLKPIRMTLDEILQRKIRHAITTTSYDQPTDVIKKCSEIVIIAQQHKIDCIHEMVENQGKHNCVICLQRMTEASGHTNRCKSRL